MARVTKKLKINLSEISDISNEYSIHLDSVDNTLSFEHYGYYLICKLSDLSATSSSRIYLSYRYKSEFHMEKAKTNSAYKREFRKSNSEIFDIDKNYIALIKDFIKKKLSDEICTYHHLKSILNGFRLYINFLISQQIVYLTIDEILENNIEELYTYYFLNLSENLKTIDIVDMDIFLKKLGFTQKKLNFKKRGKNKKTNDKNDKKTDISISSDIIYQLVTYIKEEFKNTSNIVNEYYGWLDEFNSGSFITKEDLIKTILDLIENKKIKNKLFSVFIMKLKYDYQIDLEHFLNTNQNYFNSLDFKNDKKRLDDISRNGKNIDIRNEKYAIYWLLEIIPEYPHNYNFSNKYKSLFETGVKPFRPWLINYFEIDLDSIYNRMFPQAKDIYPLYLLLLIDTGDNQEVLKNLTIINNGTEYTINADDLQIFLIIDGVKHRSNSGHISIVLGKNSDVYKYLEFYIKWASNIFKYSNNHKLFQYINISGGLSSKYQTIDSNFLFNIKNSPMSFYKKYEIYDKNSNRIDFIDHKQIRKAHSYQDFLEGKTVYERQLSKNHKSDETRVISYEDKNLEFVDAKKHKIAITQNLLVGIFKGLISRDEHKVAILFENGPLADCKNNKNPTFSNAPNMKKNEFCTDWTKCLTGCDKSCVIPKIHGPVIVSWINFMNTQKEEFIREEDWNKEYLYDYNAAIDTLERFSEEEIFYSQNEAFKYDDFVRMKFSKTVKIKGKIYA